MRVTNEAGKSNRSSIDERHAPPTTEHAEYRIGGSNPEIAEQRQLEASRNGVALDRGDEWFRGHHACRSEWAWERHVVVHSWACSTSNRFEVGSCAKHVICTGQNADVDIVIAIELPKRFVKRLGGRTIDSISYLWPIDGDRQHTISDIGVNWC